MFLTPMKKIERQRALLSNAVVTTNTRIKKISRVFSLMATVRQHGSRIKMNYLNECMTALDVANAGGKTVEEILASSEEALWSKMKIVHPHLRRKHRQLRRNVQIAQRHARALEKIEKSYVFRPGTVE